MATRRIGNILSPGASNRTTRTPVGPTFPSPLPPFYPEWPERGSGGSFPLPEGDTAGPGGTGKIPNPQAPGPDTTPFPGEMAGGAESGGRIWGDNLGPIPGLSKGWTGQEAPGTTPPVGVGNPGSGLNIHAILENILSSGAGNINQQALDARLGAAKSRLSGQRASDLARDQATLADRGLIGSGPELTALTSEGENIASLYGAQFSDIFGAESDAADQRFQNALSLATGLSIEDVKAALAQSQFSLQQQLAQSGLENTSIQQLMQLIQMLLSGSGTATSGSQ